MKSGARADSELSISVEAGFSSVDWPVASRYELRVEERLRSEAFIYRDGPNESYRMVGPVAISPAIEALAEASDEAILGWVRTNGFVGIAGNRDATRESVDGIRSYGEHLRRVHSLLDALRDGKTPPPRLAELAIAAAGHLVDATHLARLAGASEMDEPLPESDARLQAFYALAVAIRDQVTRLAGITASVDKTEDGLLVLRPRLLAHGPLSAAYLERLAESSRLAVVWDRDAPNVRKVYPTRCQWCGKGFSARRFDARYDSDRCRWAATKAAKRPAKKDGGRS